MNNLSIFLTLLISIAPVYLIAGANEISCSLETTTALDLINSTVKITRTNVSGTGVILWSEISEDDDRIKETYIITNRHVVGDEKNVSIDKFKYLKDRNTVGYTTYGASVVFVSSTYDLALIKLQTSTDEVFSPVSIIAKEDWDNVTLYEEMYLASCGLGDSPFITNGNLSSVDRLETEMQLTANAIFGSSGGGIYDDEGYLVGIVNSIKAVKSNGIHPVSYMAVGIPITAIVSTFSKSDYSFIFEEFVEEDEDDSVKDAPKEEEGEDEEEEEEEDSSRSKDFNKSDRKWY